MKRNLKQRERWLTLFESTVILLDPSFAGRIPWDAAIFHFNQGCSPGLAAHKVVQSEQPRGDSFPTGAQVAPRRFASAARFGAVVNDLLQPKKESDQ